MRPVFFPEEASPCHQKRHRQFHRPSTFPKLSPIHPTHHLKTINIFNKNVQESFIKATSNNPKNSGAYVEPALRATCRFPRIELVRLVALSSFCSEPLRSRQAHGRPLVASTSSKWPEHFLRYQGAGKVVDMQQNVERDEGRWP